MVKFVAIVLLGLVAASVALPRGLRKVPGGGRIVGGENAAKGELPYQIALLRSGSFSCGGSIIADNVVVTAAHCVGSPASTYTVIAGDVKRSDNSGDEQTMRVQEVIVHPQYDDWTSENDVALLILSTQLVQSDAVRPVNLPPPHVSTDDELTGDILVSGWGTTSSGGSLPDDLKKVVIPIVSDKDCRGAYGASDVADSMLCAGLLGVGGKDSCQGDSGGPLVLVSTGELVGVVSWGIGCAEADYPGVNTEVSYFVEWIVAESAKRGITL